MTTNSKEVNAKACKKWRKKNSGKYRDYMKEYMRKWRKAKKHGH